MIKPLEKIFLALIIATFLLPAALMLWMHCGNLLTIDWIANRTLSGVTVEKKVPRANIANWQSEEFQKGLNTLASENFAGRELLIRVYNQVLYRVFHKSYMYLESIILGRNGDLFESEYLIAYSRLLKPIPREEAEALVVMMKYISERLKEVGTSFVFVITPNKASLYPEDIPDRYLENTKNGKQMPTNYDILVPLLKKYRVPYVDGREITLEHKDALPLRAFPKTGTH